MYIQEIHLLSDNIIETEHFYNTILETKTIERSDNSVSLIIGRTKIIFNKSEDARPIYHFAIDIPYNLFYEAFSWAEKRLDILPITKDSKISILEHWRAKSFYFYDNNSNILEFISREDLPSKSRDAFSASSFLHISEIGIVTDNVSNKVNSIMERYDLPIFSKQPRQDNFTVLGGETALIVVVENNRNWFPTDIPARPFWMKTIFESSNGKKFIIENE